MISPLHTVYPNLGGMCMLSKDYWELFEETGAPELYLMFANARNMENLNASNDSGTGPQSSKL